MKKKILLTVWQTTRQTTRRIAGRTWAQARPRLHALWTRARGASRGAQIAMAVGVLVLACGGCCSCGAIASLVDNTPSANTALTSQGGNTGSTSATSPSSDSGSLPPATVTVTITPVTPVPVTPTATPKPLTPAQQIAKIARGASNTGYPLSVAYGGDLGRGVAVITEQGDQYANADGVHIECYDVLQAVWTSTVKSTLTEVDINFTGPVQDQYGNTSTGTIAHCGLTASTAAQFNWPNLDYDQAWADYDTAYTISGL